MSETTKRNYKDRTNPAKLDLDDQKQLKETTRQN